MPSLPRNLLITLIMAMTLGMLFIGLYPFNYFPENKVSINEDGKGLHFFGRGIASSADVGDWLPKDPITLELVLKPEKTYYRGIPHILALCDRSGREVMYLGQWKNSLIVRLMDSDHWIERIKREIGVRDVFKPGMPVHLNLVLEKGNVIIYTNGKLAGEYGGFDFTSAVSRRPIKSIVLGNSPTGENPWKGEILGFAILDSVKNLIAVRNRYEQWESHLNPDVLISKILTPFKREFISFPSRKFFKTRSFYRDAVINIAGFIPLGLALAILFTGVSSKENSVLDYLYPVLIGGLLSLFIETNQAFLVSRSSSATDLVLNILGTAIGASIMILSTYFQGFSRG